MAIKEIQIHQLPEVDKITNENVFAVEVGTTTYKVTGQTLINFIKTHSEIKKIYIDKELIGVNNGIVPINSDGKIDSQYISYGNVSGTSYEGSSGKLLENELTAHKQDSSNPHGVNKEQIGLGNVENKSSEDIRGELTFENITNALGFTPGHEESYSQNIAYTDEKVAPLTEAISNINIQIANMATEEYVLTQINNIINGAEAEYDTFLEIQELMKKDNDALQSLIIEVGTKLSDSDIIFAGNSDIEEMFNN